MKYIIIGQLMIWANIASVTIGYFIAKELALNDYANVVLGGIGVIGSGANLVFSIITQFHGYQQLKIIPYEDQKKLITDHILYDKV